MNKLTAVLLMLVVLISTQDIQEDFVNEIYQQPAKQVVGQETQQFKVQQSNAQPTISHQYFSPGPLFTIQKLHLYKYQCVGILLVLLYILCYIRGRRANATLIDGFYQQTQGYFNQTFSHIGFTKVSGDQPFIGESANQVIYYASGRNNTEYMEINFNMRKRQDLISLFVYQLIWPQKDTITIDIPVKCQLPLVFLLSLKRKMKGYIEKYLDIQMLTGSFDIKNLHQNYEILGESADTVDQIFDAYTVRKITQNPGLFMFIHYTDQKMFSQHSGHLRVVLNGGLKQRQKLQYLTGMQVIFHIVDRIASLKISQNSKQKAIQAREVFNSSKQKANLQKHRDQLRKKKQQKLRKQEAWLKSLPADKQKKEDQKRKRKEMNKMMKGKAV